MSFSSDVKEELRKIFDGGKPCAYAELAAFFMFCGEKILEEEDKTTICFNADNEFVIQKVFTLCKKNISINSDTSRLVKITTKNEAFINKLEDEN